MLIDRLKPEMERKINSVWEKVPCIYNIRSLKKIARVRERWGSLNNLYW